MATPKTKQKESLGDLSDALAAKREEYTAANKAADNIKDDMKAIEERIFIALDEAGITSARGTLVQVTKSEKVVPTLLDYDAFAKYLKRTGNFHFLQRRLSNKAVEEALEALPPNKRSIPGLGSINVQSLSVTKVK